MKISRRHFCLPPLLAALGAGLTCLSAGHCSEAAPRNPHVIRGLEISVQGGDIVVSPGECRLGERTAKVAKPATLPVAPARIIAFTNEPVKLSADKPAGWSKGTRLQGCNARDVNAFGSFMPDSLQIRRSAGGELLKEGEDYLVDGGWGHVGIGPKSRVTPKDTVFASYRCSVLRMDTIQVFPDGRVTLKVGESHISAPVPSPADPGCLALAHVLVPYRAKTVTPDQIYVIAESPAQAVTRTTRGRIPKTLAKLKAGQRVKIVCWGDSVTQGGNASKTQTRYVDAFAAGLKERFPTANLSVENISVGGSSSRQWLYPEQSKFRDLDPAQTPTRFQRILDAKPDLVTIEFVNDAGLSGQKLEEVYSDILKRFHEIGAEVILITPHFTMWSMMGFKGMREAEKRPYVLDLRKFAEQRQVALADASARWEHLWKEGIPYVTLLHNTINHPDDRGHRLFAEELWKCFE